MKQEDLALLDLRPVRSLSREEKARMPVSIDRLPDGSPVVVKRYCDNVWDWYPYIDNENLKPCQKQLDWAIALPDGRRLTDPEHAQLLESAKDLIWSLFAEPIEGRVRPKMQTLIWNRAHLAALLRWMVRLGLRRLSDLAGRTLDYVPVARLGDGGKKLAEKTVNARLSIVESLYLQRDKLDDALRTHPWPHESAWSLAGCKKDDKPKTEFIPDEQAAQLGVAALDYVQDRAPRILGALENIDRAGREKAEAGRGKQIIKCARRAAARAAGYANVRAVGEEATRLRTACYIVIDLFSGVRDSEVLSLKTHCIAPGKSMDGSTDVLWLHGTIYKTGKRPKRWMVPPVVEEAIEALTRLTDPARDKLRAEKADLEARIPHMPSGQRAKAVKRLNKVRKQLNSLFLKRDGRGRRSEGIGVISGTAMNQYLKEFCVHCGIEGDDGAPYPLHSHQFRRTYARFMARSELGDLMTLREHFGHWSMDMTTFYADGGADEYEADTELLDMMTEEKTARQTEIVGELLTSDAPLANGGHWLKEWRQNVRTASNKAELVRDLSDTITLNGTGHSWCIGNAKGSGCKGLCVFEAQMCFDCNYGIIGPEHRPVWEGIRGQQLEALGLDDMGPSGRARAQDLLATAEQVLRRLDGETAR